MDDTPQSLSAEPPRGQISRKAIWLARALVVILVPLSVWLSFRWGFGAMVTSSAFVLALFGLGYGWLQPQIGWHRGAATHKYRVFYMVVGGVGLIAGLVGLIVLLTAR